MPPLDEWSVFQATQPNALRIGPAADAKTAISGLLPYLLSAFREGMEAVMNDKDIGELLIGLIAVLLSTHGAFAASRTLTGTIGDSFCGASHKSMAARHGDGGKGTDAECSAACVKGGGKYVFVSEGQVYTIANQDRKDLAANAGTTVQLTGDLQGTTITVAKMAASTMKAPAAPSGLRVVSVR